GLGTAARARCVGKIRACLDHANKLVRDMLAYAGGGALTTGKFTTASLLDDFRKVSAALLDNAPCRLEVIDDSDGACIHGNREAVVTVLQNILENAIHACTARPGSVGDIHLLIRRAGASAGVECVEITLS